jgi:prepilin-type N-terminal cleavage/methylation domain-containing protein
MRNEREGQTRKPCGGFSLLEVLIVVGIITVVLAGILTQVEQMQQRSTAEQGKVDDFQQARDFLDQIFRDTRQMGYPNIRNFDPGHISFTSPWVNDSRLAVGLVKLTATELDFQGDVDGSGVVSVVSYKLNGTGTCATCIHRAQVLKLTGDPVTGQTNLTPSAYTVEVQNVQNTTAIFSAFDATGASITLPIDIDNNPTIIPTVKTIQAQLKIASPTAVDPKTGQQLEADIEGRVQVSNCSMATTGLAPVGRDQLTCQ